MRPFPRCYRTCLGRVFGHMRYRAGKRSAAKRQYYAGRGNQFWKVLYDVCLTGGQILTPVDFGRLLEFGIGLTDLAKTLLETTMRSPRLTTTLMNFATSFLFLNLRSSSSMARRLRASSWAGQHRKYDMGDRASR
jgi:hypothetical protein